MKRLETILKSTTFLVGLFSFTVNLHLPMNAWVWQLVTMFWVIISFLKSRRIEDLEIENKYKKNKK